MSVLEKLINLSIDFLRNRHHPEKPHISVLAPPHPKDYALIWEVPKSINKKFFDEVEEDDDEVLEELEEFLRAKSPGWIFGSDFELSEGGNWQANVQFKFYVRIKPDFDDESKWDESAYTQILVSLTYHGWTRSLEGELQLKLGDSEEVKQEPISVGRSGGFVAVVVVPANAAQRLRWRGLKRVLERIALIGLKRVKIDLDIMSIPIGGDYLSAQVYDKDGNKIGSYHHSFCILLGCYENLFKAYLINLGGMLETTDHRLVRETHEKPHKVFTYNFNDGSSRWSLGYLLEVEGRVKFSGQVHKVCWTEHGLRGAYPMNTLVIEETEGFILKDYYVASEYLPPIKRSQLSSKDFLTALSRKFNGLPSQELSIFLQALSEALIEVAKISNFYSYQEQAIEEILTSLGLLRGSKYKAVTIVARTAGGKTYAFLVPILISIFCSKARGEEKGVKAILAYPTKALANDQVEEIAILLFHLRDKLNKAGLNVGISFGCLHGGTYDAHDIERIMREKKNPYLPVKCPLHGYPIFVKEVRGVSNRKFQACCPLNDQCSFASFLDDCMRKTREEIYSDPPDILITDEDMINRVMSGTSKIHRGEHGAAPWFEWQLFGYPYIKCMVCLHTYPPLLSAQKCKVCGASLNDAKRVVNLSKPKILVLDEAHQIYGSFGIQVHHMLSLLEHVLRDKPLYVLSSATLKDPIKFVCSLLGLREGEVKVIEGETEEGLGERYYQRIFALIMPKAYTKDATTVRLLSKLHETFERIFSRNPKGIIFTNTLAENNELLYQLRNAFVKGIKIDGHSTDFERDREKKELEFKAGGIDLFVATSTLELGVDYGVVDYVAIYGVPAKISSFVQRIGRAGRNRDAIIVVIFDPDNPLNYSYYENYKILCDGNLRDKAMASEVILIAPMNEEAVKRAVKRWAISEIHKLCIDGSQLSCKVLVNDLKDVKQREAACKEIIKHLSAALSHSAIALPASLQRLHASSLNYRQLIEREIEMVVEGIKNKVKDIRGIDDIVELLGRDSLYDLRAADDEVVVRYSPINEQRRRELRYIVRHSLPGQVTSYKSLFFAVYSVSGRAEDLEQWFGGRA